MMCYGAVLRRACRVGKYSKAFIISRFMLCFVAAVSFAAAPASLEWQNPVLWLDASKAVNAGANGEVKSWASLADGRAAQPRAKDLPQCWSMTPSGALR